MKKNKNYRLFLIGFILIFSGCTQMSEKETNPLAGLNGGFEISKNGLPVNWIIYTQNTVPEADFSVALDREIFKEGKQSLKFDIKKCSSAGGWHSPGFVNEFYDAGKFEGAGIYQLSFWIKNEGTTFKVSGGGVTSKEGEIKTLIEGNEEINGWRFYTYEIDVSTNHWLRMELNILEPGTFWIDDVRVEKR